MLQADHADVVLLGGVLGAMALLWAVFMFTKRKTRAFLVVAVAVLAATWTLTAPAYAKTRTAEVNAATLTRLSGITIEAANATCLGKINNQILRATSCELRSGNRVVKVNLQGPYLIFHLDSEPIFIT